MKRILEFIEQKKREQDESAFLVFMRNRSIDPAKRFSFAPCMAPFVMSFADLNKYVLREKNPKDRYQEIINTHTEEDDHHFGLFLTDLRTLGVDSPMTFSDALSRLWGKRCARTRQAVYALTKLIVSADSRMRLVIVEAIESAGNTAFKRYNEVAAEFHAATKQRLHYFGEAHLNLESGHAMGTVNVESELSAMVLSDDEVKEARKLVEAVFDSFIEMGEEFLDYLEYNGTLEPAARPKQARGEQVAR